MKQAIQQLESGIRLAGDQFVQDRDSLVEGRRGLRHPAPEDAQQAIERAIAPVIRELDTRHARQQGGNPGHPAWRPGERLQGPQQVRVVPRTSAQRGVSRDTLAEESQDRGIRPAKANLYRAEQGARCRLGQRR
jgi:hypothetical protein